ncbi:hypothetical protein HXX25_07095 [Hyphobacterium sp. CCMP332]|uniref:hypothetical protein n=1 Tax=Hyphobacterium sp. CCMP332 TaxID=2749086 RepID=UPI00165099A2|nr:hypothetical protein [Hyphobacterium sp. CCMP332]QNL19091.1 hypothetical protein HXX25_07095 [Hyphobacterium sp. CCMP332]
MKMIKTAFCLSLVWGASAYADPELHFGDLQEFNAALQAIEAGESPLTAMESYVAQASPAFQAYAERYDTSTASIADAYAERPNYYSGLPALEAYISMREDEIVLALSRLQAMAPAGEVVPTYFLVADQRAGGTPVLTPGEARPRINIAVAVDMIALTADTDMTEFPDGTGGRANARDLPQVVVHENAHVLQLASQGGLEAYRSIYNPEGGSMLAVAVREGCAEYLTYLASGWRLGDRHIYGEANELALWSEFEAVMDAPPFSVPGWFAGSHPDHAEWPPQIGYWMGFQICEYYHQNAADPAAAIRDLFSLYRPDDLRPLAEAYGVSLTGN